MEVTKKVGNPDLSHPQGYPASSLVGGLRGSQGPCINSGSIYFKQELSLSAKATTDGTCSPAFQAHAPEAMYQLLWDPSKVNSQCGSEQASQDVLRLSPTSPFPRSIVGAQLHLVGEKGVALPLCTYSDNTSDMVQHGFCHPWLQVREGKAPAKVLVGWGKGPCGSDQIAPLGIRKSQWLPCFLPGEDGSAAAKGPPLAQAQDQGQGKYPCLDQAPPTSTQAKNPALDTSPMPAAAEPYTCIPDHLTDSAAITKGLFQEDSFLLRKHGNQSSVLLESSKMATSCQGKVHFGSQKPPTRGPTLKESPDNAQELEVARRQVLPKQLENPAEKPLVYTSRPDDPTPVSGTPRTQKSSQDNCSSQPGQKPLNVCDNTCCSVPSSACQVTCHNQSPVQAPREAMQTTPSSAPLCQLPDAAEDRVLVFDMVTGNTRMGLLCHDPMGSRAVLVGLMPNHPSIYARENRPTVSPDGNHASLWPMLSMLPSPVPSSLSPDSYREMALVPNEATLNLESLDLPGTRTAIRVEVPTWPLPLGMPLQCPGERTLSSVHDPGWSKPEAEKNEHNCTTWMLDASGTQDISVVQAKKLQSMNSELTPGPAPSAKPWEVPRPLLQEDRGSHNCKEVGSTHPDNPGAEDTEQPPLSGQPPPTGQPPSAEQCPFAGHNHLSGQPPLAEQAASTKQHPLPGQSSLAGACPAKQLFLTEQPPFSQDTPISKEPTFSRGPTTPREAGQASTLCQEDEALGLPAHVGVLRVPLAAEKNCVCVNREKVGISATVTSSTHWLSSCQPGSSPRAQEELLSLTAFRTPGTACKGLPMAMAGTEPQGPRLKLVTEDMTDSSVVRNLALLHGACCELVSSMDALPVPSPVPCRHPLGPYRAAVVIDTGTGFTKCGLAGEDHVLSVIPSRVQLLKQPVQARPGYAMPENREDAHPVLDRGVVSDWDALEVLWQCLFCCRLGMPPEELAVLVADSPISPRTNREKVAEILFERFQVPAMQTAHQALLALYAYGRTTGLVLGSGHGISYVAPILTGDLAPLDTYRLDVAGADLTEYLAQLLLARDRSKPKAGLANQIKEACCYVALDVRAEMARTQTQAQMNFMLPDKQVITLGSECFCCPEALFQPSLLGLNQPGLPQLALLSIRRLEASQREQLLANVVLDGGSTLVSGFPERLRQELGRGATVLGSPHRAVAAWLGGSIMVSRDSFQSLWLSRREYEEEGPCAIYKYHL
ncbi:uncharacterized protein [Saccopteryx leptura]|uniref:uncharacterized protein n=1 Tax=Saccopteryx leptura TaxID=249018 RepID=UPI00339CBA15